MTDNPTTGMSKLKTKAHHKVFHLGSQQDLETVDDFLDEIGRRLIGIAGYGTMQSAIVVWYLDWEDRGEQTDQ